MDDHISRGTVRVIEMVGVSPESFEDAVRQAIRGAASQVGGINGVEVLRLTGRVGGNDVIEFHANVKIAYLS
jgi:flavin-binding protein dodecin